MLRFPFPVYLKTAPSIRSYVHFDNVELCFQSGAHSNMTLKDFLTFLAPHRMHRTRHPPTTDHLIVQLNETTCISWHVFVRFCQPVTGGHGNAIMYPSNIPTVVFSVNEESKEAPPKLECQICYELYTCSWNTTCEHKVCKNCWRTMLLNFYSHPVTNVIPYIHCPFEHCQKRLPSKNLQPLFSNEEYRQLRAHIRKMRQPDEIHAICANSNCRAMCTAPLNIFFNHTSVHLTCRACLRKTCYYCEHAMDTCICHSVPSFILNTSPGYMSRMYRSRPRNRDLTVPICVQEIAKMLSDMTQPMIMHCPKCQAPVVKSTECNEMSHCGVKWCYCCGEMTLPNETFLCDHYGEEGCPRYESILYWNSLGATDYQCVEGDCYTESCECNDTTHKAGILQKYVIHRLMWLRNYMRFTPRSMRRDILTILRDNGFEGFVIQMLF